MIKKIERNSENVGEIEPISPFSIEAIVNLFGRIEAIPNVIQKTGCYSGEINLFRTSYLMRGNAEFCSEVMT